MSKKRTLALIVVIFAGASMLIFYRGALHGFEHILDIFRSDPVFIPLAKLEEDFDLRDATANYGGRPILTEAVVSGIDWTERHVRLKTIFLVPVTADMLVMSPVADGSHVYLHCRSVVAQESLLGFKPRLKNCEILQ